jgi:nitrate/TMAO reductase-like tetraheme cytochrome c subunit
MTKKKTFLIILVIIIVLAVTGIFTAEHYTSQPEFCGSCHIMKKYYNSWELTGHREVKCVDCHYSPEEKHTIRAKFRGMSQLFTYFYTEDKTVRRPAVIDDSSCMTSECHPKQKLNEKKFEFGKKIFYIHKTHFDKAIEGQILHCEVCHQHITADKHFEISENACFLCHFKNEEFNEGRATCSLCHEIPVAPLQKQKQEPEPDDKPVTHQSLEKAKVPCQSCHYELVQGEGEIKEEACADCHDIPETLQKAFDKKLMHQKHVAKQNARCFDCHRPIRHEQVEFLDPVREACFVCHPDHHTYQKLLLIGDKRADIAKAPSLMYDVKTNCIGCHLDERIIKGEKVLHGSAQSCVACHTEKHDEMVKDWKETANEELQYAIEIENEAKEKIAKAMGNVSKENLSKAMAMLREAEENLRIVKYGGGVHNKKYSIVLIDAAIDNLEDLMELLDE